MTSEMMRVSRWRSPAVKKMSWRWLPRSVTWYMAPGAWMRGDRGIPCPRLDDASNVAARRAGLLTSCSCVCEIFATSPAVRSCCAAQFCLLSSPGTIRPSSERVQAVHERLHRAVDARDLRVVRFDHVVLVGRVGALA